MPTSISILLAEPNLLLREKIAGVLARKSQVWCVHQVDVSSGLLRGACDFQPDLILADLGALKDLEILANLRRFSPQSKIFALVDAISGPYLQAAERFALDGLMERSHVEESMDRLLERLPDTLSPRIPSIGEKAS